MKYYDTAMKLPILLFTAYFARKEYLEILEFVGNHPYIRDADFVSKLDFVSRISVLLFLATLMFFHLARRHPLKKFSDILPKLAALSGTTATLLFLLLPRAPSDPACNFITIILILGGNYFCMIALMSLGRSLSIMPEARKLVTEGLYRYIRHPLYLAEEAAVMGFFLQYRSFTAGVIFFMHFLFQLSRMHYEEKILTEAFPEYVDYCRRTRRLIPGVY